MSTKHLLEFSIGIITITILICVYLLFSIFPQYKNSPYYANVVTVCTQIILYAILVIASIEDAFPDN